jgi:hypothetical protein
VGLLVVTKYSPSKKRLYFNYLHHNMAEREGLFGTFCASPLRGRRRCASTFFTACGGLSN